MSPKLILAQIAIITGVPVSEITGPRRTQRVVRARTLAFAAIRWQQPSWTLVEIAEVFYCDHTTIITGLQRHARFLTSLPGYLATARQLIHRLTPASV